MYRLDLTYRERQALAVALDLALDTIMRAPTMSGPHYFSWPTPEALGEDMAQLRDRVEGPPASKVQTIGVPALGTHQTCVIGNHPTDGGYKITNVGLVCASHAEALQGFFTW